MALIDPPREKSDGRRPRMALLMTALVAGGVAVVGAALSLSHEPHALPPAPSALPIVAPPTDRPLVWFRDGEMPTSGVLSLRATDWQGHDLGGLALRCASSCGVKASPDGQRLLVGEQSAGRERLGPDVVYDAAGTHLSTIYGLGAQWADDSRHLCVLNSPAARATGAQMESEATLEIVDTSAVGRRTVATVSAVQVPTASWVLAACNLGADRAVVTYNAAGVRALRVVQISTGRALLSRDGDAGGASPARIDTVVVCGDGSLAFENLALGAGVERLDLDSGSGAVLPPLGGRGAVIGVSWSGRFALTPIGVFDTGSGVAIWQAPSPAYLQPSNAQPRGDGIAVLVWDSGAPSSRQVIVHGTGKAISLPATMAQLPPLP